MAKVIYLDYAAATPMAPKVIKAMEPYLSKHFYNPSATYKAGRDAKAALEKARSKIARQLGAKASEIVFTAGATEANNLAIQGIMRQFPEAEILISAIEHDSVLAPAELFNHKQAPVTSHGLLRLETLAETINPKTVLISIILINNELGTLQPIKQAAQIVKKELEQRRQSGNKLPLYLHTDAAQAPSYLNLQVARLGVDLLTINGSKIYGPKQSGALFVKAGLKLEPLILGGGQERGLRSGTENVASAVALAEAFEMAQQSRTDHWRRIAELKQEFINQLAARMPKAVINGSLKHSSPHILNVSFSGFDNERLMIELDERGIVCATGSACSAADEEPSRVLTALGLNDDLILSSLRFSFGQQTTRAEIKKTVAELSSLTASNR